MERVPSPRSSGRIGRRIAPRVFLFHTGSRLTHSLGLYTTNRQADRSGSSVDHRRCTESMYASSYSYSLFNYNYVPCNFSYYVVSEACFDFRGCGPGYLFCRDLLCKTVFTYTTGLLSYSYWCASDILRYSCTLPYHSRHVLVSYWYTVPV